MRSTRLKHQAPSTKHWEGPILTVCVWYHLTPIEKGLKSHTVAKLMHNVVMVTHFTGCLICRSHYTTISSWFTKLEALGSLGGKQD